ncbi:MAG TPA: anti-sigma factor [Stellaceae bacterium]|nr:anti-sigma factor [Stellaceae bacterium]
MSAPRGAVEEHELHARLDGCLPPERRAAVDAYLAADPELQARLACYAKQQARLRAAFAEESSGPIPARLRLARLLVERRRRRTRRLAQLAASIVLLAIGGVGGWAARDAATALLPGPIASSAMARVVTADAIAAYRVFSVEIRHPVEVDATQQAQLVSWLSRRLGRRLIVPDLSTAGYQLMGGRLLPAEIGAAAQFMYQDGSKHRLTLYLRTGIGGDTAFRFAEKDGVDAFYWSDHGFGYALAARTDRQSLLRIAEIVYRETWEEGEKAKTPPASTPPR